MSLNRKSVGAFDAADASDVLHGDDVEAGGHVVDLDGAGLGDAGGTNALSHVAATGGGADLMHMSAGPVLDTMPQAVGLSSASVAATKSSGASSAAVLNLTNVETELTFLSGVNSSGVIAPTSFATWNGVSPATYDPTFSFTDKWGSSTIGTAGGTVTYYFDAASNWTATEKAVFVAGLALWSAEVNIQFAQAGSAAAANFSFVRGTDSSAYWTGSGSSATVGSHSAGTNSTGNYISLDTSVPGFGAVDGSFSAYGGYVWQTIVHEEGHMLGLGHAGPYNGSVVSSTDQFSPYDSRLFTLMSYIEPSDTTAKYYANQSVTGTNWGTSTTGGFIYGNDPTTPMMLDILAAQRLYGAATGGPLSGGQVFGFNSNIAAPVKQFFDFTVNTTPVVTLYDSGVGNTLDLSGWSANETVNLTPGTFSSVNGATNNIGIALGTRINTYIGGSGNDNVVGSGGNDTLKGGPGINTLNGGGGFNKTIYAIASSAATIVRNANGTVTISGAGFSDTLTNIEQAVFTDKTVQLREQARADFNGDGTSDVVLQNGGTVVNWTLQGGLYNGGNVLTTGASGFTVVGKGDFNGDGTADLLLQGGGTVVQWTLVNGAYTSGGVLATGLGAFNVVGTGDFNGDGTSDVVLQSGNIVVSWTLQNGAYQSGSVLSSDTAGFQVVGTGDFNGDGTADVVLQSGGSFVEWTLKNGAYQSGSVLATGATGYSVVGTGDFNRDGTTDVLIQNGNVVVEWLMQNGAYSSGQVLTLNTGGYQVVATGDYNNDGICDVLLQSGGSIVEWNLTAAGLYASGGVIATGATGFQVK